MEQNKTTKQKSAKQEAVDQLLEQLPTMDRKALLKLWRDCFDRVPSPSLRREMLIPILAYRIQEKAFGGLKASLARELRELAEAHVSEKKSVPIGLRPKTGTRYVREYEGKLHEVTVLESSYEYEGKNYGSLTEIAKLITGAHWSGPLFFGLKKRTAARGEQ